MKKTQDIIGDSTTCRKLKKGYTLVELLFVMAIISIIIGIGISNTSGSTEIAENTAAKGNLRNVVTEAQLYFANNGTYAGFTTINENVSVTELTGGFCLEATGGNGVTFKYNSLTDSTIVTGTCTAGGPTA